jgi:hypothetical protein
MNATPKKTAASGNPASTGIIAKKIGTAPRRPTHEMKAISGAVYRKGSKHSATVTGRATSMSTHGNQKRRPKYRNQGARRHKQSQHQEEDDLAEPSKGIERLVDDLSGTVSVPAEDKTRQVDGQEPTCAGSLGTAEEGAGSGERQNGVQSRRRFHTIDQSEQQIAANDAEGTPAHDFPGQQCCNMRSGQGRWGQHQTDQKHCKQHRERIIDAGLQLESPGDTRPQLETA